MVDDEGMTQRFHDIKKPVTQGDVAMAVMELEAMKLDLLCEWEAQDPLFRVMKK